MWGTSLHPRYACPRDGCLDLLAVGLTPEQVISELPYLELDGVRACIRFVSQRLDYPVVTE